jgi:hypothetical protein
MDPRNLILFAPGFLQKPLLLLIERLETLERDVAALRHLAQLPTAPKPPGSSNAPSSLLPPM